MKIKNYILSTFAIGALLLTSCSKLGPLSADNFTVTPSPLEAQGGQVQLTVNGKFPEKYMKKKAEITVVPELRYADGATQFRGATFQGEKVLGNNQEISYRLGGNYTMQSNIAYKPEMQLSELYMTFVAKLGKKQVQIPAVKVANGVVATSDLIGRTIKNANPQTAADAYQYAIAQRKDANIRYLVAQSKIRSSELESATVQEFIEMLRQIKADQKGYAVDNIEVSAFASPEGTLKFNTKLAEDRQKSSQQYLSGEMKNIGLNGYVEGQYTAEDWEGFQELVAQSNIQDKDVILRVLSMYDDPEERERRIRDLSVAFQDLAQEILPELRRARLTINYNVIGRSDAEIEEQYAQDPTKLSVEELLYAATLTENPAQQKAIYQTTAQQNPTDYRALNNLAALALQQGDTNAAAGYLDQAQRLNKDAAEIMSNKAMLALSEGDVKGAETYLSQATTSENYGEMLGNLLLAQGKYAQAEQALGNVKTNSAALSQILNRDYSSAAATLEKIAQPDATTDYLKAVLAARLNRTGEAMNALKAAFQKDATLKQRAAKDLEFIALFPTTEFQQLVR